MSEHHSTSSSAGANPFSNTTSTGESTLLRVGGSLGIAGCIIGMAIFVAACAGFDAAMRFSPLSLTMGGVGLILSVMGSLCPKSKNEVTHELASVAVNILSILGALVVMAAWLNWPMFYK